jgi:glycosyltransferase involved in cell wall biosynthesis
LTVLQSFPAPRATSVNPYTRLLAESLEGRGIRIVHFSWSAALTARFDVFHVHWPEILVEGHSPLKQVAREVLTLLFVVRMRLLGRPIVRTMHNLGRPEGLSRVQNALIALIERQTAVVVTLNESTTVEAGTPVIHIPHGHYRGWFAGFDRATAIAGRGGYAGRIRRYKGVELLLDAFAGTRGLADGLSLHVAGYPSTEQLANEVTNLAAADDRVELALGFISDAQLVDIVTSSTAALLPYRFMHNSAAAITALSLDRPVVVPRNEVNERLAIEVGPGWVRMFEGELSPGAVVAALTEPIPSTAPNLGAREWPDAAAAHERAYRIALGDDIVDHVPVVTGSVQL